MKASVLDAIKRSAAVPSMPQVVMRFLEVIQDPNFSYADVAKVLSADAGTVSEILRLTNSPLFGVQSDITSLQQALTLLGPKRTRSLVLGRYLVETVSSKKIETLDMSYYWRRSLAQAVVASQMAQTLLPRLREEAFLSGLLADIGIPILSEAIPDAYEPVLQRYYPYGDQFSEEQERERVGVTHAEVSAMVLTYWSLPETITRAVNMHQSCNPGQDTEESQMVRILNASDRISKILCQIPDTVQVANTCEEVAMFAGIQLSVLAKLIANMEQDVQELAQLLKIDVIPSNIYSLIVQTIQEQLLSTSTT